MLAIVQGCKKEDGKEPKMTMSVSLKSNQTYQYDLGSFGDEEGAVITSQALHFQTSKIGRDVSGKIVYTYVPAVNYIGTDEVEISTRRGGSDGSNPGTVALIDFKLTMTN